MATSRHASLPALYRSRTPLTDEQIQHIAPSVFATEPHESRKESYAYIPTSRVLQGLRNEGFLPFAVGQSRSRIPGKGEFTKHLLRFRKAEHTNLVPGQEVPEIIVVNSHDGTSSYQIAGGIFRVVCSNGLIVGDDIANVRVRHSGRILDNVIEGSYQVIQDVDRAIPIIEAWKSQALAADQQLAYAEAALDLRWDRDDAGNSTAPISASKLLGVRRYDDRGNDVWRTFNTVQENLIRGGLRGIGSTGRRTSTRAVASVTENVKLNKALWTLTSKLAEVA
jgi:hypothetical protein